MADNSGEDRARQTVCEVLATLAQRGCGQFQARWFFKEKRLQFQGEQANRWESIGADYHGEDGARIADVLRAIRQKRNEQTAVSVKERSDHELFTIRVDAAALKQHAERLTEFFRSHLFWD